MADQQSAQSLVGAKVPELAVPCPDSVMPNGALNTDYIQTNLLWP